MFDLCVAAASYCIAQSVEDQSRNRRSLFATSSLLSVRIGCGRWSLSLGCCLSGVVLFVGPA